MSKRNIKANFIQKNNIIYDNGKINQNQNKFPNQLNSKSVFMIAKDGIMIDFNGDGIYDKKIKYPTLTQNNNTKSFNNELSGFNGNDNTLSQRLNDLYGSLGFSFSNVETNKKNSYNLEQPITAKQITFTEQQPTTRQTSYTQEETQNASLENLKTSIENLNLSGVKVEIVNKFKK